MLEELRSLSLDIAVASLASNIALVVNLNVHGDDVMVVGGRRELVQLQHDLQRH